MNPADRYLPYPGTNVEIIRRQHRTSCEKERNELRVFEYKLGEHYIMWDRELGLVYWTGIWQAIGGDKIDLPKALTTDKELRQSDMLLVRGGKLTIQGTWIPYPNARKLALRTCYRIRHDLVPVFGPDFVTMALPPDHPEFIVPRSQVLANKRRLAALNLANGGPEAPARAKRPAAPRVRPPHLNGHVFVNEAPGLAYDAAAASRGLVRPRPCPPPRSLTPHLARAGPVPHPLSAPRFGSAGVGAKRIFSQPPPLEQQRSGGYPGHDENRVNSEDPAKRRRLYAAPVSPMQSPYYPSGPFPPAEPSDHVFCAASALLAIQNDTWRRPTPASPTDAHLSRPRPESPVKQTRGYLSPLPSPSYSSPPAGSPPYRRPLSTGPPSFPSIHLPRIDQVLLSASKQQQASSPTARRQPLSPTLRRRVLPPPQLRLGDPSSEFKLAPLRIPSSPSGAPDNSYADAPLTPLSTIASGLSGSPAKLPPTPISANHFAFPTGLHHSKSLPSLTAPNLVAPTATPQRH
ncbi:hypothetical protein IWQ60_002368 [Tieghemiomyces parasiticus]|uniref:HTH APSES-type domain-containing protein n=1 Tax=Tieghemiomyces parasiticus TaxID=78921 RepID=A0A9W8ACF9_9FUNG|nr:hypothetical protein IWQ60_002368 [Tieghemiomyces parasiticus]